LAVGGRGNYWSDYRGWDESGDGIGDLPYVSESLFESLVDRQPLLRLFLFSPAQQAVEMAAATFPVVRPRPKLRDEAPLLRAPAPPDLPRPRRSPWPMGALAAGLLCFGSLSLAGGRWRVPRQTSPPPPPASAQAPPRSAGPGACR
jgi:nitrous oxidase accessory protein